MTKPNPNGRVLYEGPSMLDGVPIVVIATGFAESSANDKTGAMIQTWILRQDIPPHHAFKSGEGSSVCGGCPHYLELAPRRRLCPRHSERFRRPPTACGFCR